MAEEDEKEGEKKPDTELQTELCGKAVTKCLDKPIKMKNNEEIKKELSLISKYSSDEEYHTLFFNFVFLISVIVISLLVWFIMIGPSVKTFSYLVAFIILFDLFLGLTEKLQFEKKIKLSDKNKKAFNRNLKDFNGVKIGEVRFRLVNKKIMYILVLPIISSKNPIVSASLAQPLKKMYIEEVKKHRNMKIPKKYDKSIKPIDEEETCESFQIIKRNLIKAVRKIVEDIKEEVKN